MVARLVEDMNLLAQVVAGQQIPVRGQCQALPVGPVVGQLDRVGKHTFRRQVYPVDHSAVAAVQYKEVAGHWVVDGVFDVTAPYVYEVLDIVSGPEIAVTTCGYGIHTTRVLSEDTYRVPVAGTKSTPVGSRNESAPVRITLPVMEISQRLIPSSSHSA